MTDGNRYKSRLSQPAPAIVVIGIGQEPHQNTCENKHCSEQQRFDH